MDSLTPLTRAAEDEITVHIIDGGTGPGIWSLRDELAFPVDILSEPDTGIYEAMNKGLSRARGRYVWFLNGGDLCTVREWPPLRTLLTPDRLHLILCAYRLDLGRRVVRRKPRPIGFIRHGLPTSHQAIFYPREAASKIGYDQNYRIAGDYQLTAELIQSGLPVTRAPLEVARFVAGGQSHQEPDMLMKEAAQIQRTILGLSAHRVLQSRLRHEFSGRLRRTIMFRMPAVPRQSEGMK